MNHQWREIPLPLDIGLKLEICQQTSFIRKRITSNNSLTGAVIVAKRNAEIAFISISRPESNTQFLELPRGGAETFDANVEQTARRELYEEIGVAAAVFTQIGKIWPDNGLLTDSVAVFATEIDPRSAAADTAEFKEIIWLSKPKIAEAISAGKIADGISLSAIAIYFATETSPAPKAK